ncbi:MAG: hypothetical protein CMM36_03090 [Rhodospirillaceae bacterium]|nr:hypothetical protein [Rhodospirillaceae bacterium]
MKKLIFNVLIFFVSSVILYLLVFIYFFFTFEKDFKITKENFNFQSLENLNFYKKYSKKVNHLRFDPAIASSDFLTSITDVLRFCVFLGLATLLLL